MDPRTIVTGIICNKCKNELPPMTIEQHLKGQFNKECPHTCNGYHALGCGNPTTHGKLCDDCHQIKHGAPPIFCEDCDRLKTSCTCNQ